MKRIYTRAFVTSLFQLYDSVGFPRYSPVEIVYIPLRRTADKLVVDFGFQGGKSHTQTRELYK